MVESSAGELKCSALPKYGEGRSGPSHATVTHQGQQELRPSVLRRFVRDAYMLLAPVLSSSNSQLHSAEGTKTNCTFEVALRDAVQKDGGKLREEMYLDWVLLSKSSREHENGHAMRSETIRVLLQEFERLQNKRLNLMSQRVKVREARTKLRGARRAMRETDTAFELSLQRVWANETKYGIAEIKDLYEHLQESREALHAQEEAYDVLENDLLVAEFEMSQVEDEIHGQLVSGSTPSSEVGDETVAPLDHKSSNSAVQKDAKIGINSGLTDRTTEQREDSLLAAERLVLLENQLRRLRRSMEKVNKELNNFQENLAPETDFGLHRSGKRPRTPRELSERHSDLAVQILLLEEDAKQLEDIIFHQQAVLFSGDIFGLSAAVLGVTCDAASPIIPEIEGIDDRSRSEESPIHALDSGTLDTSLSFVQPRAFAPGDDSTVSGFINSWLLEIARTSALDALSLRAEIEYNKPSMNTVEKMRESDRLWFSDGSQLWYATGRKEDVRSVESWTSTDISTHEKHTIWDSHVLSSNSSPSTDNGTIVHDRSRLSADIGYPDEGHSEGSLVMRSSSQSILNLEQGSYYDSASSTTHFEPKAKDAHPLIFSLETRPLAIHYLLRLSNSPTLPWSLIRH